MTSTEPPASPGANTSRKEGEWQREDYYVFDGDRDTGSIVLDANNTWTRGVSLDVTKRKATPRGDARGG